MKSWQAGVWLPILPPMGALLELIALVAIIFMIDWAIPSIDIAAIEPSPYWIPVLLLSLQYGTVAGLMAAAAAIGAHVLNGFPEQGIGENLFAYLLRIWSLPILWIGVSLLVGQFRLRQIEVKQELRHKLAERSKERDSLAGYAESLQTRCARLERDIATRGGPPGGQLLTALSALDDQQTDFQAAFAQLCNAAYPGAAMSVFALNEQGLHAAATTNWHDGDAWPRTITPDMPIYRAVVGERRALSALHAADDDALAGQGLAAAPVIAPDTGRIAGLIKIERAPPGILTRDIARQLAMIARVLPVRLGDKRHVALEPRIAGVEPRIIGPSEGSRPPADIAPAARGFRLFSWHRPELVSARPKITSEEASNRPRPRLLK